MHKIYNSNSGWRERWKISGHEMHHSNGLVVRFERASDDDEAWNCEAINADEITKQLANELGDEAADNKLQRLIREAVELFEDAIAK